MRALGWLFGSGCGERAAEQLDKKSGESVVSGSYITRGLRDGNIIWLHGRDSSKFTLHQIHDYSLMSSEMVAFSPCMNCFVTRKRTLVRGWQLAGSSINDLKHDRVLFITISERNLE